MNSQAGSITVCYQYGHRLFRKLIDSDVPMSLIDQDVWHEFSADLPVRYSISFYDTIQRKLITLDQKVLDSDANPFRSNCNEIERIMGGVGQILHLYIIDDASEVSCTNQSLSSAEIGCSQSSNISVGEGQQSRHTLLATLIYTKKQKSSLSHMMIGMVFTDSDSMTDLPFESWILPSKFDVNCFSIIIRTQRFDQNEWF
jgi:hypothetical protein